MKSRKIKFHFAYTADCFMLLCGRRKHLSCADEVQMSVDWQISDV